MTDITGLTSYNDGDFLPAASLNSDNTIIAAAFNTYAVQTNKAVDISVSHTWSAAQTFGAGFGGTAATLSAEGALTFSHASARIIPGATSLLFRNNANDATNLTISNAGAVTTRNALTVASGGALIEGGLDINSGGCNVANGLVVEAGGASVVGGLTVSSSGITVTGNSTITGTLGVTSTLTCGGGGSFASTLSGTAGNFSGTFSAATLVGTLITGNTSVSTPQISNQNSLANIILGASGALATNAVTGFVSLPTCAGVPSGSAVGLIEGSAIIDTTNFRLYVKFASGWKMTQLA